MIINLIITIQISDEAIKLLLEAGADPYMTSDSGNTPLHGVLLLNKDPEIAKLLIEHHADLSLENKNNKTAQELIESSQHQDLHQILSHRTLNN